MTVFYSKLGVETDSILVYMLENNRLAAQYLRHILYQAPNIKVKVVRSLAAHLGDLPVDERKCVVVMDLADSTGSLSAHTQKMRGLFPNSRIILLAEMSFWEEPQELVAHGYSGFVSYADLAHKLCSAVECVSRGFYWIPDISGPNALANAQAVSYREMAKNMTKREKEIVELVKNRLSNKEIGGVLNISEATVKFHVSNIFTKLKVSRRCELFSKGRKALFAVGNPPVDPHRQSQAD